MVMFFVMELCKTSLDAEKLIPHLSDEEKWEHVLRLRFLIDENFDDQKYWIDYANTGRPPNKIGPNYTLRSALDDWHHMNKFWNFMLVYTVFSPMVIFYYFVE